MKNLPVVAAPRGTKVLVDAYYDSICKRVIYRASIPRTKSPNPVRPTHRGSRLTYDYLPGIYATKEAADYAARNFSVQELNDLHLSKTRRGKSRWDVLLNSRNLAFNIQFLIQERSIRSQSLREEQIFHFKCLKFERGLHKYWEDNIRGAQNN